MRFYGVEPRALLQSETWVLDALARELPALQAEEQLKEAQLWMLFNKQPQTRSEAANIRHRQHAFIRKLKRTIALVNAPAEEKKKDEVEMIDPATLSDEERARLREWAASQGIETQE